MKGYRLLAALAATFLTMGLVFVPPAATQRKPPVLEAPPQEDPAQDEYYAKREKNAPQKVKDKLAQLRREAKEKGWTFGVSYTEAMDYEIEQLAGAVEPPDLAERARKQNEIARQQLAEEEAARAEFKKKNPNVKLPEEEVREEVRKEAERRMAGDKVPDQERAHASLQTATPLPSTWDWRSVAGKNRVTPVRDQKGCPTCWAFTAAATYESSYLITKNLTVADVSEQSIASCGYPPDPADNAEGCHFGNSSVAFNYLKAKGAPTESRYPYTSIGPTVDNPCKAGVPVAYRALDWGYVHPTGGKPTVVELKRALYDKGPLYISVRVTLAFASYNGVGVFNERATGNANHAVTLIGWDDKKSAWLIKNSWGPGWGGFGGFDNVAGATRGYMWINYASNNVGYGAAWVKAK